MFLLISIGAAVTAAYDPASLYKLLITVVMGMVLFLAMSGVLRDLHLSIRARWPVAIAAGALLAFNVVLGERIFGAKNWISIGPLSFQPSELVKIALSWPGPPPWIACLPSGTWSLPFCFPPIAWDAWH